MLSPEAQTVLDLVAASGAPRIETLAPAEAQRQFLENLPALQGEPEAVREVRDLVIASPAAEIPLRVYRGTGCPESGAPCLVYFHGGGWVLGNCDTHDTICRWIANLSQGVVVSVDYRLAPEHPFPAAIEDAMAAIRHVATRAEALGIDRDSIAVGGDSAGGNIAAVMALLARDGALPPLDFQILFYPVTDVSASQDSYTSCAEGYGLTTAAMRWYHGLYLSDPAQAADWRVSPLRAPSLADVAAAFVLTAGYDPLHDEARDYAVRLRAEGVSVQLDENPGQIHGFLSMDRFIRAGRPAVARAVAAWLGPSG
ncbi:MAG TPA: alpha/beta hydrolase [Acidisoma sp.]|jgi:acetyl esterase|uniref:alpha/beta hydrolase n=1 Tax=Acidisoma sp. TaxID=1872115 RepID=UPI002D152B1C|nr:alpha/beta hydrolase [Acidisoma sp.]HTH99855.1 alpha/beta hydrolase [Acidisoma sp.]